MKRGTALKSENMLPQEICKLDVRSTIGVIIFYYAMLVSEVENYVTHRRGEKQ